ncbi:hypothetical protein L1987_87942 [Smallanthus sonchifolius]|nr:hypothetical protein L1987_87942 [Smallanthus sonchifolius]
MLVINRDCFSGDYFAEEDDRRCFVNPPPRHLVIVAARVSKKNLVEYWDATVSVMVFIGSFLTRGLMYVDIRLLLLLVYHYR